MSETTLSRRSAADSAADNEHKDGSVPQHAQKQLSDAPEEHESALTETMIQMAPASLRKYLDQAQPFLDKAGDAFNFIEPYVEALFRLCGWVWRKISPYHPEEFLPAFFGLVCAFFGGYYFTLIAAVEALNQTAWEDLKEDVMVIVDNFRNLQAANKVDNQLDENNDGIADVLQIDRRELATRKLKVALITLQPRHLSKAMSDIALTFFAVVATLKVRFAEAVTLGAAIGGFLSKFACRALVPALRHVVPKEYHAWIRPLLVYFCKAIGVSVAWTVHRFNAAIHSSIRGGQMFTFGTLAYLKRRGIIGDYSDGDPIFGAVALGIAVMGFYWQLSNLFGLPFPFNVILFPFTIMEYLLMWVVNSDLASHGPMPTEQ